MKHLIISVAALALMAGSASAQQETAPSTAPAPAQTAPTISPPPPPAELAPDAGSTPAQPNNGNAQAGPPSASAGEEEEDTAEMDGDRDELRDERRFERRDYREHSRRWERDRPRWHEGPRHGWGPHDARRGARIQIGTDDNGQVKLDVRCPANEPLQTCADVVNDLLDRLNSDGRRGGNSDL